MSEQSPAQITVHPLPLLPNPSALTAHAAPTSFLLTEARRTYDELGALRQSIISDSSAYLLDPPGVTSLPPLPPIPTPPTNYRQAPAPTKTTSEPKPNARPPIPSTSPLSTVLTIQDCLEAFNSFPGASAETKYDQTALWASIGNLNVWILLNVGDASNKMRVRSIRIYDANEGERPVHAQSSRPPLRALSRHLTELGLHLPDLFYRLSHLPDLLSKPCHYCNAYLKIPDGLPYSRTGTLPSSKDDDPKWISWHPSCEPFALFRMLPV